MLVPFWVPCNGATTIFSWFPQNLRYNCTYWGDLFLFPSMPFVWEISMRRITKAYCHSSVSIRTPERPPPATPTPDQLGRYLLTIANITKKHFRRPSHHVSTLGRSIQFAKIPEQAIPKAERSSFQILRQRYQLCTTKICKPSIHLRIKLCLQHISVLLLLLVQ